MLAHYCGHMMREEFIEKGNGLRMVNMSDSCNGSLLFISSIVGHQLCQSDSHTGSLFLELQTID